MMSLGFSAARFKNQILLRSGTIWPWACPSLSEAGADECLGVNGVHVKAVSLGTIFNH